MQVIFFPNKIDILKRKKKLVPAQQKLQPGFQRERYPATSSSTCGKIILSLRIAGASAENQRLLHQGEESREGREG